MRIINYKVSDINMKYYYKVYNINILCTLHITKTLDNIERVRLRNGRFCYKESILLNNRYQGIDYLFKESKNRYLKVQRNLF